MGRVGWHRMGRSLGSNSPGKHLGLQKVHLSLGFKCNPVQYNLGLCEHWDNFLAPSKIILRLTLGRWAQHICSLGIILVARFMNPTQKAQGQGPQPSQPTGLWEDWACLSGVGRAWEKMGSVREEGTEGFGAASGHDYHQGVDLFL